MKKTKIAALMMRIVERQFCDVLEHFYIEVRVLKKRKKCDKIIILIFNVLREYKRVSGNRL